jgi:hypothetical protein
LVIWVIALQWPALVEIPLAIFMIVYIIGFVVAVNAGATLRPSTIRQRLWDRGG